MMKSYLVACIVVLCACLVLGKPAPSGTKVNSQDISKSINRLIEDLRTHKAAEDHDQKELVKIVLAFAGKLQELQEGIQHIDEVEGQAAKATAKREGSEGGDFLERLDKRGQYYDAELDDGFDMFKKRNQKQEKKAAARGEQTKEYASELEKEKPISEELTKLLDLLDAKKGQ
ncbi:uncharacterized protein LOC135495399 isoform X9 [Lineus longissimus]|uniref:uncharacterized protein LOC135495399 isoform X9 n=1 Tax=Lineus longissimus TaxID=88925 RepID=UPI00315DE094